MAQDIKGTDPVGDYLRSISKYPLLTKDDEARLCRLVRDGREASKKLSGARAGPCRRGQLGQQVQAGETAAAEFVNSNLRLVVSIAKRYRWSGLPLLDLVQEGNLGLVRAAERFDWRMGYRFSTYATLWIRQAIGQGVGRMGHTVHLPSSVRSEVQRLLRARRQFEEEKGRPPGNAELAIALDLPKAEVARLSQMGNGLVSLNTAVGDSDAELGDFVADVASADSFDAVVDGLSIEALFLLLNERERRVVRLRFGLGGGIPRTLEEVGTEIGLTKERIRQIEKSALDKLRCHLAQVA
jgi:RNA polymerase sigma factor (sigma-70 family)